MASWIQASAESVTTITGITLAAHMVDRSTNDPTLGPRLLPRRPSASRPSRRTSSPSLRGAVALSPSRRPGDYVPFTSPRLRGTRSTTTSRPRSTPPERSEGSLVVPVVDASSGVAAEQQSNLALQKAPVFTGVEPQHTTAGVLTERAGHRHAPEQLGPQGAATGLENVVLPALALRAACRRRSSTPRREPHREAQPQPQPPGLEKTSSPKQADLPVAHRLGPMAASSEGEPGFGRYPQVDRDVPDRNHVGVSLLEKSTAGNLAGGGVRLQTGHNGSSATSTLSGHGLELASGAPRCYPVAAGHVQGADLHHMRTTLSMVMNPEVVSGSNPKELTKNFLAVQSQWFGDKGHGAFPGVAPGMGSQELYPEAAGRGLLQPRGVSPDISNRSDPVLLHRLAASQTRSARDEGDVGVPGSKEQSANRDGTGAPPVVERPKQSISEEHPQSESAFSTVNAPVGPLGRTLALTIN